MMNWAAVAEEPIHAHGEREGGRYVYRRIGHDLRPRRAHGDRHGRGFPPEHQAGRPAGNFSLPYPPAKPPTSATHGLVAASGLAAFLLAVAAVRIVQPFGSNIVHSALVIIAATALGIFLVDLGWQKVHLRASTGLDFDHDDPSWPRTLTKFVGLLGCLGFLALGYWLFPVYRGEFFVRYFTFLQIVVPPWIALAIPYFFWIDRKMLQPRDGYWHLGKLLTFSRDEVDSAVIGQLLLGWVIKGFFLPLMFGSMCNHLADVLKFDFATLTSFRASFDFTYNFLYFIDVGMVPMGYLLSLRLTDTHLRSAEPTMLGWTSALVCYEPFWSLVGTQYIIFNTGYSWSAWTSHRPALMAIWGGGILFLVAVYVWATVIFGARFSNLTHRGIITNGPYRWTKHPAYIAKNLSWWMVTVPFLPRTTWEEAVRCCLLLLLLNLIYYLRAKTEERHLSWDPDYVRYAQWIKENGILSFFRRLPGIRLFAAYRAPQRVPG